MENGYVRVRRRGDPPAIQSRPFPRCPKCGARVRKDGDRDGDWQTWSCPNGRCSAEGWYCDGRVERWKKASSCRA